MPRHYARTVPLPTTGRPGRPRQDALVSVAERP